MEEKERTLVKQHLSDAGQYDASFHILEPDTEGVSPRRLKDGK